MSSRPGVSDLALFILAVAGLLVFFLWFPAQHPDAAADYSLGRSEAAERAERFLTENGISTYGLQREVRFYRAPALVESLQVNLGRRRAVALLQTDTSFALSGYYWEVSWRDADVKEDEERRGPFYQVELTPSGALRGARVQGRQAVAPNREALASLFATLPDNGRPFGALLSLPDSLLSAALSFSPFDPVSADASEADPAAGIIFRGGGGAESAREGSGEAVRLGSGAAVRLARYHLARSALAGAPLRLDSLWLASEGAVRPALLRFVGKQPYYGQSIRVEIGVMPSGSLRRLETEWKSVKKHPERRGSGLMIQTDQVADVVELALYLIFIVVFVFLFFRQFNARVIDPKPAIRDAIVAGTALGITVLLVSLPEIVRTAGSLWTGLAIAGVGGVLAGAGSAVLIFLISAASESLAREVWPRKVATLDLVRMGALRNVPVGKALLRGAALTGVGLGLMTLVVGASPDAVFEFEGEQVISFAGGYVPLGIVAGVGVWYTMFVSLLMLLGIGTLLRRWSPRAMYVVPVLVAALTLVQIDPLNVRPVAVDTLLAAVIAVVFALAFWHYDVLTCFVGYLFLKILVETAPGWMAPGSPTQLDALVAVGLFGAVAAVGVAGVLTRRTGEKVPEYVPSYVVELAREERLKRELELARQVQETFLPRTMPDMPGLDVAAMCLAAQEVGGDYYDFIRLGPKRLAVVVGDVSGKGIQAAFYMTLAKGFLQTLCRSYPSPAEVMRRMNDLFYENAPRGMFISMIYGVIDTEARTFTFARAGHNPVILKRSPSRDAEVIQPRGMAIGLVSGAPFGESIEAVKVDLHAGDVLVLYTDGFSEAMNDAREIYGDDRLAWKISGLGRRTAADILSAVSEDVHHFVDSANRHDDMTMVVVKFGSVHATDGRTIPGGAVRETTAAT